MRLIVNFLMMAVCVWGQAKAQDFQIGGASDTVTAIPLEIRPSLGLFVQGYVNGHGPYRFNLSIAGHTMLTPAVVHEAGLAEEDNGVAVTAFSNQFHQSYRLHGAFLLLGDRKLSLDGAQVYSDRDLSAYVPVSNYGGQLGVELFRNQVVQIDQSHGQLILSSGMNIIHAPDAIELSLDQSAVGAEMDRMPSIKLLLDGQPGKFRVNFGNGAVNFLENSPLGRELLGKSLHQISSLTWTPDGIVAEKTGAVGQIEIGGYPLGPNSVDLHGILTHDLH